MKSVKDFVETLDNPTIGEVISPKLDVEQLTGRKHPVTKQPIYTKVFKYNLNANDSGWVSTGIEHGCEAVVKDFQIFTNSGRVYAPTRSYYVSATSETRLNIRKNGSEVSIRIPDGNTDHFGSGSEAYLYIEYCKTSDVPTYKSFPPIMGKENEFFVSPTTGRSYPYVNANFNRSNTPKAIFVHATLGNNSNDGHTTGAVQSVYKAITLAGSKGLVILEPGFHYADGPSTTYNDVSLVIYNSITVIGSDPKLVTLQNKANEGKRDTPFCNGSASVGSKLIGVKINHYCRSNTSYNSSIFIWSGLHIHNCVYNPTNGYTRSINYNNDNSTYPKIYNSVIERSTVFQGCYSSCGNANIYNTLFRESPTTYVAEHTCTKSKNVRDDYMPYDESLNANYGVYSGTYSWEHATSN